MKKIVWLQFAALLMTAAVCSMFAGYNGFQSALLGGFAYLIPSLATVLLLKIFKPYPHLAGKVFLLGEGLKVVLSLVFMLVIFYFFHETLAFIPFLLGLLAVSHLVFLAFLRVKDYGR
ncbi:ATP synthase subunit I [Neisseria weaveri]|uniref:ATP synthase I n=1 Tax=Neisseria weaveri TaxID=28091 RepID=A0A3S4ZD60_9NEIS|nr:ATP synthase subunit I [Neisseria weaveri]EGV36839.1 ATP synthase I [Neisseria weaveri LMG 5135]EGV37322.1 ATP synthase I [Neisseria weaveri ATCC 51223]SAY51758.1 ATP synthase I [Neisseria weaveri]VEJ51146.1 ATP synthase I [Neisseria weaveri]